MQPCGGRVVVVITSANRCHGEDHTGRRQVRFPSGRMDAWDVYEEALSEGVQ
jgi:hypothetical protein